MTTDDPKALMDRMYRSQRHIYDATRKYYLLGRDELIASLAPPVHGAILEIACGTGRNLVKMARAYPTTTVYGVDISDEMLATARAAIDRAGLTSRVMLAQADATTFDAQTTFGRGRFDRVVLSYALSMIPPWRDVLRHSADLVAPGGSLDVVDFGDQADLPPLFKQVLERWLRMFHVTPRLTLDQDLAALGCALKSEVSTRRSHRGYAITGRLVRGHISL